MWLSAGEVINLSTISLRGAKNNTGMIKYSSKQE